MAIRHDPAPDAGNEIDERGGPSGRVPGEEDGGAPHPSRRVPWWILAALALIVAGAVYAFSRGCDGVTPPVKSPVPTPSSVAVPPAFEEIVLEVDPAKFLASCLAAGGTEAGCQATLGDMTVK